MHNQYSPSTLKQKNDLRKKSYFNESKFRLVIDKIMNESVN
jgi:hypothetical protein